MQSAQSPFLGTVIEGFRYCPTLPSSAEDDTCGYEASKAGMKVGGIKDPLMYGLLI